jgi:hypothetical protein
MHHPQTHPCPLRKQVGFFLHTPFPSSEIYRTLPVREELLRSGEQLRCSFPPSSPARLAAGSPPLSPSAAGRRRSPVPAASLSANLRLCFFCCCSAQGGFDWLSHL